MFQFAGFPSAAYMPSRGCTGSARAGSPIQAPADPSAFATPRSFSQLIAPFIGPQCQGIRPAPYFCLAPAFRTPSVACFRLFISAFRCHPWALRPARMPRGCFVSVFGFQGTAAALLCQRPWRLRDSNSRPPACKAGALPAELSPLLFPAAACFPMPSPA